MKLKVLQPKQDPQIYPLSGKNVRVGRCPNSDIHLDDTGCSRDHCIIESVDDGYQVVDLGSFNGTKVNGERISTHKLQAQDKIQIGKSLLVFMKDSPRKKQGKKKRSAKRKTPRKETGNNSSKSGSPSPSRRRPVRRANKFTQAFFLTYGAFLLAWVGHKVETQVNTYNKQVQRYQEAIVLMEEDRQKAQEILQEITQTVPGTNLAKKAEENMEPRGEEKESPKNSVLENWTQRYERRKISAQEYLMGLEDLLLKNPELRKNSSFGKELRRAQKDYETEMNRIYNQVQELAFGQVQRKHFTSAIEYYQKFAKKYPNPWKKSAREEIGKVNAAAKKNLSRLSQEAFSLVKKGEKEKAIALVKEAYPDYTKTLWREDMGELVREIESSN